MLLQSIMTIALRLKRARAPRCDTHTSSSAYQMLTTQLNKHHLTGRIPKYNYLLIALL